MAELGRFEVLAFRIVNIRVRVEEPQEKEFTSNKNVAIFPSSSNGLDHGSCIFLFVFAVGARRCVYICDASRTEYRAAADAELERVLLNVQSPTPRLEL